MSNQTLYETLAKAVSDSSTSEEEKKEAREEAVLGMTGLIKKMIARKYSSYISNDPSFYEDLYMSSVEKIIEALPKYDSEKCAPSTYFGYVIKNALYTETTKKSGKNSPQMRFSRNVLNAIESIESEGRTPTTLEIARMLSTTERRVSDILCLIRIGGASSFDEVSQGDLLAGDPFSDSSFSDPEDLVTTRETTSDLIRKISSYLTDSESQIFIDCIIGDKSYKTYCSKADYQTLIEKIKKIILSDSDISELLGKRC